MAQGDLLEYGRPSLSPVPNHITEVKEICSLPCQLQVGSMRGVLPLISTVCRGAGLRGGATEALHPLQVSSERKFLVPVCGGD